MRRTFCTLIAALFTLTVWAQEQQDFATRFMDLYGEGSSIERMTISPQMLERVMRLPEMEENSEEKEILSQLKSIQMLTNADSAETKTLYGEAVQLAQHNAQRYKLRADADDKKLYIRERGEVIVEMVLLMRDEQSFLLINFTGNMTDKFLEQVFQI